MNGIYNKFEFIELNMIELNGHTLFLLEFMSSIVLEQITYS